ncbi:MAG TPA: carbon starvation CstA family protein, partial [Bacillales bacterium]
LILVLMVNAVFAWAIANLFVTFPSSVLSIFIQIPLAIWIGYAVYKKSGNMLLPSVAALIVMYGTAVLASYVPALQIDLISYFGGADNPVMFGLDGHAMAFFVWIVILMIYVYIASVMPVWKLLQPRDYINSHQLVVGLLLLYLGLIFSHPTITAPATNPGADVSWFPLLFITIACGAISGFHGLVSSGTSSKQLNNEKDARFVGYLGAIGEGSLALVSIIAVVTLFPSTGAFKQSYSSFAEAGANGLNNFVAGAGQLATGLSIPAGVAETIVAVIVISFAATSLDTSVRLMRYIISEIGSEYKLPSLSKTHVATSIAVIASAALTLLPQGPKGFGSGGYLIWPLFGTSNQLLAGISLMLISIWLHKQGRNYIYTLVPMVFLLFMTVWAMIQQVFFDWLGLAPNGDFKPLLFIFGFLILVFALWVMVEAFMVFSSKSKYDNLNPKS